MILTALESPGPGLHEAARRDTKCFTHVPEMGVEPMAVGWLHDYKSRSPTLYPLSYTGAE